MLVAYLDATVGDGSAYLLRKPYGEAHVRAAVIRRLGVSRWFATHDRNIAPLA